MTDWDQTGADRSRAARKGGATPLGSRRSRFIALTVLAGTASAVCAYYATGELVDDAYIDLRYVANFVAGRGLVFNPGERVEGYTNFLWVILLSATSWLGFDPEWSSRLLGASFAVATVVATATWLPREPGRPLWSTLLAPALLALNPLWALWAVLGLETALFTFLVTLGLGFDSRVEPEEAEICPSALFYALATLARPEGAIFFVVSLAYRALRSQAYRRWMRFARETLAYGLVVGSFMAWRLHYYGELLPNTFYAKTSFTTAGLPRGLGYLAGFFLDSRSILLFLLLLPAVRLATSRFELRLTIWVVFAYLAGIALEGGDGFPGFRFVVPILPALYFLLQEGAFGIFRDSRRRASWLPASLCAVGVTAALLHFAHLFPLAEKVRSEINGFTANRKLVGLALREQVPSSTTIALSSIGAVPYFSGLYTYDMLGLTDRHIARTMPRNFGHGKAGHEKGDGRYILERRPDLILIGNVLTAHPSLPLEKALSMDWPYLFRTEAELVDDPELYLLYRRDALRLADGEHLMLLRRHDFVLPASSATHRDQPLERSAAR